MFTPDTIEKVAVMAESLGVDAAALLAIAEVESAGVTEWDVMGKKLPPIRFEGHYFYRLLKSPLREAAVKAGLASPVAGHVYNPPTYQARYDLLKRACEISEPAALMSTSWGLGQVMGEHWQKLGYASVKEMVNRANEGVDGQIEIMSRYIQKFGLVDELKARNWRSFANQYNGPASAKNGYAAKIGKAYLRYLGNDPATSMFAGAQKGLQTLGYYPGPFDSRNSLAFRNALAAFQKASGLVADGKWGPMSAEAVEKALAAKKPAGVTPVAATAAVGGLVVLSAVPAAHSLGFDWATIGLAGSGFLACLYAIFKGVSK